MITNITVKFLLICVAAIYKGINGAVISENNIPQNIVGGEPARIEDFPAVVDFFNGYSWQTCGGTLISRKHVLTAAHCLTYSDPNDGPHLYQLKWYNILSGDVNRIDGPGLEKHNVTRVDVHKRFFEADVLSLESGDIAILTLEKEITVGPTRKPAKLPSTDVQVGQRGVVLGWGWTQPDDGHAVKYLNKASLQIQDNYRFEGCQDVSENGICAIDKPGIAFCNGDSGGPFFVNGDTVVGVVSNSLDCTGRTPGIFTKVLPYKRWIEQVMRGEKSYYSAVLPIGK